MISACTDRFRGIYRNITLSVKKNPKDHDVLPENLPGDWCTITSKVYNCTWAISTQTWQLVKVSKVQSSKFKPTMHKVQEELCSYILSNLRRNDAELLTYARLPHRPWVNENAWKLGGVLCLLWCGVDLIKPSKDQGAWCTATEYTISTSFTKSKKEKHMFIVFGFWILFLYIILCQSESKEYTHT
jgi:hypothetical protein